MSMSFYKYISYLSVDVAIGAVISSAFVSKLLEVYVPTIVYITLGLVVWSIYTFDHLIDARKGKDQIRLPRHQFHLKHFSRISASLMIALAMILCCLFMLPSQVIIVGTALGLIVILYFISINFLNWKNVYHKEFTVALVYFSGILVGPVSSVDFTFEFSQWFYLFSFFILVLLNLLIFSKYDQQADRDNNFPSIYRVINRPLASGFIYFLMLIFTSLIGYDLLVDLTSISAILGLMFIILCFIHFYAHTNLCKSYYRYLGDGIFILPVLYLI